MTDLEISRPPIDDAYETAFREHFDRVASYAERHGAFATHESGEDVAQTVMLRAWNHYQQGELDLEVMSPWLYIVAKRIGIDNHRRLYNKNELPAEVSPNGVFERPGGQNDIELVHRRMAIEQALGAMSDVQRAAVELTYLQGFTINEAAEKLGIPGGTVKSRTHHGLAAAQAALRKMGLNASDILG